MIDPTLKVIADNPALYEALLKFLSDEFATLTIGLDKGKNNEELGEIVRARLLGDEVLRDAFKKIKYLQSTNEQGIRRNEAR